MKFQFLILAKPTFNQLIHKVCTFIFQLGMSQMLYMCSSFWLLGVESRDFSQAEKEELFAKLFIFASSSFFLSMRKIMCLNSQQPKNKAQVGHPDLPYQNYT